MIFGLQLAQYVLLGLLLGFSYFQLELKQDVSVDNHLTPGSIRSHFVYLLEHLLHVDDRWLHIHYHV